MKIAILIAGYLRSFEYNIDGLKKYIINNHDVDVYLHITKNNVIIFYDNERDINQPAKRTNHK